jgi:hypothetical protein
MKKNMLIWLIVALGLVAVVSAAQFFDVKGAIMRLHGR